MTNDDLAAQIEYELQMNAEVMLQVQLNLLLIQAKIEYDGK